MNADQLFSHYENVTDAPDAIPRLRRFILDLAVRGKLVEQDSTDEPPFKLLGHARCRLEKRAESVKRMKWKATETVTPDEIKKDFPQGWAAARVNDTGFYINGMAFKPADWKQSGVPIIRIQNLTDPSKEFNYADGEFPDEVMVRDGDLLVSWSATLEAFKWERGEGILNQHIFRVIPDEGLTTRDFLLLILRNAIREMAESDHAHGLVMTHINRGPFLNHIILIPPFAEQRRIVAKVDQLMALCARLEAARVAREVVRGRLAAASFARLTAPDPNTFQYDARVALEALIPLTTHPDQIKPLRQTILNLAVRGKLVNQDPTDEPPFKLLGHARRRLEKRAESVKRMRWKVTETVTPNEIKKDFPQGWVVARVNDTGLYINGMAFKPADWKQSGVPIIRIQNLTDPSKEFNYADGEFPDEVMVRDGDLLVSWSATLEAFKWERGEGILNQHIFRVIPDEGLTTRDFLLLLLRNAVREMAESDHAHGLVMTHINRGPFLNHIILIPPLAEQQRIVARVDALMALCNRLEASLSTAATARRGLLDAFLAEALDPAA